MSDMAKKLVYVEWSDSYGCSSTWQRLEGEPPEVMICRSVGYLVRQTKHLIVIVPHVTPDRDGEYQMGCGDMTIPIRAVTRIVTLKVPRKGHGR